MSRKTYTSSEVKDRWNRKHYDRVIFHTPAGAREEIKRAAEARGMSLSAYIRALVIRDTAPDETPTLRGGGVAERWEITA